MHGRGLEARPTGNFGHTGRVTALKSGFPQTWVAAFRRSWTSRGNDKETFLTQKRGRDDLVPFPGVAWLPTTSKSARQAT